MADDNSSDFGVPQNDYIGNTDFEPEARILTQEELDEQIETYIAPLIKQLNDLTRLIQGMSSVHPQNLILRASTRTNSSAAGLSPDIVTGGTGNSPDSTS